MEIYDDDYVRDLFSEMGPSYSIMNLVSSFGFSEIWRWKCVRRARLEDGDHACDLMAGSGECWRYARRKSQRLISIDFCPGMIERQEKRLGARSGEGVEVRCENACATTIEENSIDTVFSAFGLKTLTAEATLDLAREIRRILRPGGTFALLEISVPPHPWLKSPYEWYLGKVIPWLGKTFLNGIECYRMLGVYTTKFGSCETALPAFEEAGLECRLESHWFGCATSIHGRKP